MKVQFKSDVKILRNSFNGFLLTFRSLSRKMTLCFRYPGVSVACKESEKIQRIYEQKILEVKIYNKFVLKAMSLINVKKLSI